MNICLLGFRADYHMFEPTAVSEEELTLKSICKNPIIIYRVASKQAKISENVKICASIYDISGHGHKYRGINYGKVSGNKITPVRSLHTIGNILI